MSPFTLFRSAVCAGFAIGLGGAVYLQQTSKALGALLFTIGLFAVCECRFHLFTGKEVVSFTGRHVSVPCKRAERLSAIRGQRSLFL